MSEYRHESVVRSDSDPDPDADADESGEVICGIDGCAKRFNTENGAAVHRKWVHGFWA